MFIRQLFDRDSSTYTYLIADPVSGEAALIDPVREQFDRDLALIGELGFTLRAVLETHVHADHVTGGGALADRTGARLVASVHGAPCADEHVRHGDVIPLGAVSIEVLGTPGHTPDSLSFRVGPHVFTGDALLVRGTGRTDFQGGDAAALYDAITTVLFALPDETRVWPGHDYRGHSGSTIGEERVHNPRVAGRSRSEFVELMGDLGLPAPRKIEVAVPANRACGREVS